VAELRNSSGNFADCLRIFRPEASYRRRGIVGRRPWAPHNRWARPGPRPRPLIVWPASGPLQLSFGLRYSFGKNKTPEICFVQFREYFLCSFSEPQKQQKTENWHCDILSIG
jgi:hypothetical protein